MRYGITEKLLIETGREFENEPLKRLSKLWGIKIVCITSHNQQTNRQVERMNQTIIRMLKCLPEQYRSNWCHDVNKQIHAYNY